MVNATFRPLYLVPTAVEAGLSSGLVCMGPEYLASAGVRNENRPSHIDLQYQPRYNSYFVRSCTTYKTHETINTSCISMITNSCHSTCFEHCTLTKAQTQFALHSTHCDGRTLATVHHFYDFV